MFAKWGTISLILAALLAAVVAPPGLAQSRAATEALRKFNREFMPLYQKGKHKETIELCEETLAVFERELGPDHQYTLIVTSDLALEYRELGRYSEAERLAKRALAGDERTLGPDNPSTLTSVNNLAFIYASEGRYEEAEPLWKRALAGRERALGRTHESTLESVNNLGSLYMFQGRYAEAEPLLKYALAIRERTLSFYNSDVLVSLENLASLYVRLQRYAEAEALFKRSLSGLTRVFGPEHPNTVGEVANLGWVYYFQARYSEAEALLKRALALEERDLGALHTNPLQLRHVLSKVYFARRDWPKAVSYGRDSAVGYSKLIERAEKDQGQALTGKIKQQTGQQEEVFWGFVKATYRQGMADPAQDAALAREAFQTAQWAAASEAAQSLTQMAARGAAGDPRLAALARARQDLIAEWHRRDGLRNSMLGQPKQNRNLKAEAENQAQLDAIDTKVAEIDRTLRERFPDYAALTSSGVLPIEEVQAQLRPDEALVLFLDTPELKPEPEETFIWVVTKTEMRWVRSHLGTAALAREVQALRCGLDAAAWEGPRCAELTGQSYTEADRNTGNPLPFDHARAHKLYQALFGQVEDLIKGQHLLLVPSGPLTQLPFQVLVTAPPANSNNKSAAWLIRDHAITVLPAVSSLKALRRVAQPSAAEKPMIGFGNPLLDGPSAAYASLAKLARENKTCAALPKVQIASAAEPRGLPQIQTRGGIADAAFLRKQAPLPETADELCAVARDLHADDNDIHLGSRATESEVKRLSESGQLAKYRVVHFATHGALAGQLQGNAEPGLVLTPPDNPNGEDDGYLTASEIAGLKLDADWVILSACNTAAGNASGAAALSGLARAFIYAQARALLVSHWAVNSDATVKLITGAMSRLAADQTLGRAEAMRQSMLALVDGGQQEAHPAYWAPFVVVGEGGAAR